MPCNHDVDDIAALVNAVIDGFQIRPYKKRGFLVVQQGSPMGGDLLMSCLDPPSTWCLLGLSTNGEPLFMDGL